MYILVYNTYQWSHVHMHVRNYTSLTLISKMHDMGMQDLNFCS